MAYMLENPETHEKKVLDEEYERDMIDMLMAKGWRVLKKEVI
jgi:hypothetical protein